MTKRRANDAPPSRVELERQLSADMRAMTARSDRVGRHFARLTAGVPLTSAQLRQRMDVTPAAITYLVDRMIDAGHIRREPDPADRRKWLLRYEESGMTMAHAFFRPLGAHLSAAMADLTDKDLVAAHRVLTAMIDAMATFEDDLPGHTTDPSARVRRGTARPRRQETPR
jgi:DNA-binding MarR family transcriptional regulator